MEARLYCALALSALLVGCANFKAVSEFAQETEKVTSVVRKEFIELDSQCKQQAELTIVVNDFPNDTPLRACKSREQNQRILASVTLDVLDDFAGALHALANDKSFDLSSNVDSVTGKLGNLKDSEGRALVSEQQVGAITSVLKLLASIATEAKREQAVRRLVAEKENLAETGRILKSFFVGKSGTPPPSKAPYQNLVELTLDRVDSTYSSLDQVDFRRREPIRTAELRRATMVRRKELERRAGEGPDKVPVLIAGAIDSWLFALEAFSDTALKPEPKEFLAKLKELRSKVSAVRDSLANPDK